VGRHALSQSDPNNRNAEWYAATIQVPAPHRHNHHPSKKASPTLSALRNVREFANATIKPRLAREGTLTDLRDMRREQAKARTKRFQIGEEEGQFKDRSTTTTTTTTTSTSQRQFERWARVTWLYPYELMSASANILDRIPWYTARSFCSSVIKDETSWPAHTHV
jgi:hypothetical protein